MAARKASSKVGATTPSKSRNSRLTSTSRGGGRLGSGKQSVATEKKEKLKCGICPCEAGIEVENKTVDGKVLQVRSFELSTAAMRQCKLPAKIAYSKDNAEERTAKADEMWEQFKSLTGLNPDAVDGKERQVTQQGASPSGQIKGDVATTIKITDLRVQTKKSGSDDFEDDKTTMELVCSQEDIAGNMHSLRSTYAGLTAQQVIRCRHPVQPKCWLDVELISFKALPSFKDFAKRICHIKNPVLSWEHPACGGNDINIPFNASKKYSIDSILEVAINFCEYAGFDHQMIMEKGNHWGVETCLGQEKARFIRSKVAHLFGAGDLPITNHGFVPRVIKGPYPITMPNIAHVSPKDPFLDPVESQRAWCRSRKHLKNVEVPWQLVLGRVESFHHTFDEDQELHKGFMKRHVDRYILTSLGRDTIYLLDRPQWMVLSDPKQHEDAAEPVDDFYIVDYSHRPAELSLRSGESSKFMVNAIDDMGRSFALHPGDAIRHDVAGSNETHLRGTLLRFSPHTLKADAMMRNAIPTYVWIRSVDVTNSGILKQSDRHYRLNREVCLNGAHLTRATACREDSPFRLPSGYIVRLLDLDVRPDPGGCYRDDLDLKPEFGHRKIDGTGSLSYWNFLFDREDKLSILPQYDYLMKGADNSLKEPVSLRDHWSTEHSCSAEKACPIYDGVQMVCGDDTGGRCCLNQTEHKNSKCFRKRILEPQKEEEFPNVARQFVSFPNREPSPFRFWRLHREMRRGVTMRNVFVELKGIVDVSNGVSMVPEESKVACDAMSVVHNLMSNDGLIDGGFRETLDCTLAHYGLLTPADFTTSKEANILECTDLVRTYLLRNQTRKFENCEWKQTAGLLLHSEIFIRSTWTSKTGPMCPVSEKDLHELKIPFGENCKISYELADGTEVTQPANDACAGEMSCVKKAVASSGPSSYGRGGGRAKREPAAYHCCVPMNKRPPEFKKPKKYCPGGSRRCSGPEVTVDWTKCCSGALKRLGGQISDKCQK
eukprot:gnl/MRDRNA2_/MRDRNA2_170927_c0_seq1.p1 gnl/MRDRNA2_/MRDRNA2_170927_c0~~gnl/MRDRNA2_/MRDRNA2_170927_c0_seq1.p1  ORF type:complete len:1161 (+),score=150.32 gnl/MRDRNA2_/MRDRNA2_170927_c0_seq1:489-3485(+)